MSAQEEREEADAWQQYADLHERFTLANEVRPDLRVVALACQRGVRLELAEFREDGERVWSTSGKRNVATMRELAAALIAACDFVDAANPEWAARRFSVKSDPAALLRLTQGVIA